MSYEKPYEGLKVIDFSQGVAGPYCGMLLAQHGAEVIKIEPKDGDWARNLGQEYGQHSAFSVTANLGKKSFVIDLKNKNSQSILDKIISNCDIFIEGFSGRGKAKSRGTAQHRRETAPKIQDATRRTS